MAFDEKLTITGIQKAQQNNLKRIHAVQPKGTLGKAIHGILVTAFRYAVTITHVDTGSYRASQRMEFKDKGDLSEGRIFVDPKSRNPRTGQKPVEYSIYEEARGGSHATYKRTIDFMNQSGLLRHGVNMVRSEI